MQISSLHPRLRQLGLEAPVFQAPIGSVASPELAAAVSEAGGLGHLACTWRSPVQLAELFQAVRKLTAKPFGANFVVDFPIEERLAVALEHRVPVISFFWGDGSPYLERVKRAGATAIQVVGSISEARRAAEAGFDLIVAQGREAGGHVRGKLGLMALLPQTVDVVAPVPVLAAGGIADRRGVVAALSLGAVGVWVGTRFLAAREANIHPIYQDRVLASSGDDTLYSELFDIGWQNAPMRTLSTSLTEAWRNAGHPNPPDRPGEGDIVAHRADGSAIPRYHFGSPTREVAGDIDAMALYAGEAVGLVRSSEPSAEIVRALAGGMEGEAPSIGEDATKAR